ncbi:protocatechuate 3,4-dioxygenase subunit alpha [Salaquimonas pukyongi]|uniref:protocatechuate 3,4-dioxygenase subunit alpha n=1 Tax=Salaquimonas pukyongi TaxID=2712698 RepID=UPI00096BB54D|nr:protocatechuate 3,4-dioxygenase subunit alpha [Salaquimonas pukyongi]
MARKKESPSQTAGPYVHIGLTPGAVGIRGIYAQDLGKETGADAITLTGTVFDGAGEPVRDCLIEFTQADEKGRTKLAKVGRKTGKFTGFARVPVDLKTGKFRLKTAKPGAIKDIDGTLHAPHITAWIVARGINIGLHTRIYFADEAEANAADPVLSRVPKSRRATLIADKTGKSRYCIDIRLQGEDETVFFDV